MPDYNWGDIYDTIKDYGSRGYKAVTSPLLPDYDFENQTLDNAYDRVIRPLSSPLDLALLSAPMLRGIRGLGKVALAGRYTAGRPDIEKAMYSSMLSSPQTPIKAGLGSFSGALVGAAKRAYEGDFAGAGLIAKELLNPVTVAKRAIQGFKSNPTHGRVPQGALSSNPNIVDKVLEVPTRVMNAVDRPAIEALKTGGYTETTARRLTLSGEPETSAGKKLLSFLEEFPASRIAIPFPRVGVHMLEQSGFMPGTSPIRRLVSTGLAAGAYAGSDYIPDELTPYVSALAGPMGLPVAVGLAAGHVSGEKGIKGKLSAAGSELGRNLPVPLSVAADPLRAYEPENLAATFTPNILRDFAKAGDPYERAIRDKEGAIPFGQFKSKVPGLRETLPVKSRKVDVFGNSIAGREDSALQRFFTSEPYRVDVTPDEILEAKEFDKYGVKVSPPRLEKNIKVRGKEVPLSPENAEQFQKEQRELLRPMVEKLIADPRYQALSDADKKRLLEKLKNKVNSKGRSVARKRAIGRAGQEQKQ